MRIGFPVLRLGYLKGMESLIRSAINRGHEVVIICIFRSNNKAGEDISPDVLQAFWPTARICEFTLDSLATELAKLQCHTIIGLDDLISPGLLKPALDNARSAGTRLFSVSYLYEAALRTPEYMDFLDCTFYLSEFQRNIHLNSFPEFFGHKGAEWLSAKTAVVGCTSCDQLALVDRLAVRKELGIPPGRQVVLFMSLKLNVPEKWRRIVFNDGNKLRRSLQALTAGKANWIPDIWAGPSYGDLCRELRRFCDRQDALLVVKSRLKNGDPPWMRKVADIYVETDPPEVPYSSLKLIAISDLCIHFESFTTFETAFAGVPSVSVDISQEHLYRTVPVFSEAVRSKAPGSIFNSPGVIDSVPHRDLMRKLQDRVISDYRIDPASRKKYIEKYLGFDDTDTAARILKSVEDLLDPLKSAV